MKIRLGIPRSIFYYYYKNIWKYFFEEFNIELVVSPNTNKKIMEEFTGYNRDGLYPEEIEIVKEIEKFDDNKRTKCEYVKNAINFLDKEDQLKILKSLF